MGGHTFVHKRAEHFLFPPDKLIVVGYDTEHVQGAHPLWRADAQKKPEPAFVDSVRKHGFLQPVRARKLPKGTDLHLRGDLDGIVVTDAQNDEYAEIVVGRERVKAGRLLVAEGQKVLVPVILWPAGTSLAEIIGAANAENYQRKTEGLITQAEHVCMQLRAEGYFDGADEKEALKSVSASTGFSVQRIRNLLAFREDKQLVESVRAKAKGKPGLNGEAALAIATLPPEQRAAEVEKILANPELGTVAQVRERVSHKKNGTADGGHSNGGHSNGGTADGGTASEKSVSKTRKGAKKNGHTIGLSKALMQRIVTAQMAKPSDDRALDDLVLKSFKVASGVAEPSTIGGLLRALKDLGL